MVGKTPQSVRMPPGLWRRLQIVAWRKHTTASRLMEAMAHHMTRDYTPPTPEELAMGCPSESQDM
jgi:hypothetical protein